MRSRDDKAFACVFTLEPPRILDVEQIDRSIHPMVEGRVLPWGGGFRVEVWAASERDARENLEAQIVKRLRAVSAAAVIGGQQRAA